MHLLGPLPGTILANKDTIYLSVVSDVAQNEPKRKGAIKPGTREEVMGPPRAEMLSSALAIVWPGWIAGLGTEGWRRPGGGPPTALPRCCAQPIFSFPSRGTREYC